MLMPFFFASPFFQQAHATSMVELTMDQLIDASEEIVKGTIVATWTEQDPKTQMLWTHAQIEIEQSFRGEAKEILVIEQPGGNWGSTDLVVEGVARFSEGETGYFFVEYLPSDRYVPVGMFQGKFNVLMDPYSQKEIVHRYALHPSQKFDHRFIPLPQKQDRISTEIFEDQIWSGLDNGWDGNPIPGVSSEKLQRINAVQNKNHKDKQKESNK